MKNGKFAVIFAAALLAMIIGSSLLGPILALYPPNEVNMDIRLQAPTRSHPLGTDALGRDMLSRILYGGRASMALAFSATLLSMLLGLAAGIAAGWFGGAADWLITTLSNIFQGLPGTCFVVAIAGALGPGIKNLLFAVVITNWAGFSRIVRTETLRLREEPFIEALGCLGCGNTRIILRHLLPNILNNVIVLFTTRTGRSLLSIAALSFLGLGVQPPTPDWSVMINDARMHYRSSPHLILVPGVCVFLLVFAINMLGDALRDLLDVKNGETSDC